VGTKHDFRAGEAEQMDLLESMGQTPEYSSELIPDASFLLDGHYQQVGHDLVITDPAGEQYIVGDYFSFQTPPNLVLMNGAGLSPSMVKSLLHQPYTDDILFAGPATSTGLDIAIGTVKFVLGKVLAIGTNGVERVLSKGDILYKGDEIQTDGRGFIRATMNDGTRFHLGKNARAVLDEFEYNEADKKATFEATVLKGGFHYKSGKIGKLTPGLKHSLIKTPSAFIGIRGSELDGTVRCAADDDEKCGETVVIHKSGILEITDINGLNSVTLNVPGHTSVIVMNGTPDFFETASPAVQKLVEDSLPPVDTSENDVEPDGSADKSNDDGATAEKGTATKTGGKEASEENDSTGTNDGNEDDNNDDNDDDAKNNEDSADPDDSGVDDKGQNNDTNDANDNTQGNENNYFVCGFSARRFSSNDIRPLCMDALSSKFSFFNQLDYFWDSGANVFPAIKDYFVGFHDYIMVYFLIRSQASNKRTGLQPITIYKLLAARSYGKHNI